MEQLIQHGLSNAAAAAVLAVLAAIATRLWRNPHFAYALWLIVLLRLVAPPLFAVSVPLPAWTIFPQQDAPQIAGPAVEETPHNLVDRSFPRDDRGATPTALRGRAREDVPTQSRETVREVPLSRAGGLIPPDVRGD